MIAFYATAIIDGKRKLYNLKGSIKEQVRDYIITAGYSFDSNEELILPEDKGE